MGNSTNKSMLWLKTFFQLRTFSRLKSCCCFFKPLDLQRVMHAFVTCRLDYFNALYTRVSQSSLAGLQLVQNAAARLMTGTKKRDHITPALAALHWLTVHYRIQCKVALFIFKTLNGHVRPGCMWQTCYVQIIKAYFQITGAFAVISRLCYCL